MSRPDLGNGVLVGMAGTAVAAIGVYFVAIQPWLSDAWRTPGSPALYLTGVLGALLLLLPMGFVVAKRIGSKSPPAWYVVHVLGGTIGAVLIAVHSAGYLRRPPALLLLLIMALVALGLWGRIGLARRMAGTFASKQRAFAIADPKARERFATIIAAKRALLVRLDPEANEGTFSLTLAHWLRSPRLSARYERLVRIESRLMGMRASVGLQQAHWRALHLAIAYVFLAGIIAHVITVTFFAGYVAEGGPITWWHITKW